MLKDSKRCQCDEERTTATQMQNAVEVGAVLWRMWSGLLLLM
jgi:hypothetical protein